VLQNKRRAMELLEQQKAELEHRRRTIIAPDGQWSCS